MTSGPTLEKNDLGEYLSDCTKQKDSKYKELKSSDQPVRASVVGFLEVDLSMGKGAYERKDGLTVVDNMMWEVEGLEFGKTTWVQL